MFFSHEILINATIRRFICILFFILVIETNGHKKSSLLVRKRKEKRPLLVARMADSLSRRGSSSGHTYREDHHVLFSATRAGDNLTEGTCTCHRASIFFASGPVFAAISTMRP